MPRPRRNQEKYVTVYGSAGGKPVYITATATAFHINNVERDNPDSSYIPFSNMERNNQEYEWEFNLPYSWTYFGIRFISDIYWEQGGYYEIRMVSNINIQKIPITVHAGEIFKYFNPEFAAPNMFQLRDNDGKRICQAEHPFVTEIVHSVKMSALVLYIDFSLVPPMVPPE